MNNLKEYYIEIECHLKNKFGNQVCGDVFLSKKIKNENKTIAVLSDGLGSGIKANILATMTASMAINFTTINEPIVRTAKTIMDTLPVDPKRQISYATFSIINIDSDGETKIIEYDNPPFLLVRDNAIVEVESKIIQIQSTGKDRILRQSHFQMEKNDRLIFFTDGITQAGIGSNQYPFGWSLNGIKIYVHELLQKEPTISAYHLSKKILNKAEMLDGLKLKDDAACLTIYSRLPRKLLVCTGPPYHTSSDTHLAEIVNSYPGKKVICGGTTAQIIARENKKEIKINLISINSDLPPESEIEGIDLVTEGILTLGKIVEILENDLDYNIERFSVASKIINLFFEHDAIQFLVGTRINIAHQDPSLPVELEIRRSVIKKVAQLLETKFLKEVKIDYI